MAGLKAGHVFNTFPTIEGKMFPKDLFILNYTTANDLINNQTIVQIIHRFLGLLLLILVSVFSYQSSSLREGVKKNILFLLCLLIFQFILGIITLISKVSIVFASMHQLLAILFLLLIIKTKHSFKYL